MHRHITLPQEQPVLVAEHPATKKVRSLRGGVCQFWFIICFRLGRRHHPPHNKRHLNQINITNASMQIWADKKGVLYFLCEQIGFKETTRLLADCVAFWIQAVSHLPFGCEITNFFHMRYIELCWVWLLVVMEPC